MAEQKSKTTGGSDSEMLYIGIVTVGVLALCLRFLIPVMVGLTLSVLISLGVRGLQFKKQLKSLALIVGNFTLLTYLAFGFPIEVNPKQFFGWLGMYASKQVYDAILAWDDFLKHGHFLPAMHWAYILPKSWIVLSSMFWSGLPAAVVFFAGITFLVSYHRKKVEEKRNTLEKRVYREEPNALGKLLSLPLGPILKWALLKPAHEGHEYALSIRTGNFWLRRVIKIRAWLGTENALYAEMCWINFKSHNTSLRKWSSARFLNVAH